MLHFRDFVEQAAALSPGALFVIGDITSEGRPHELRKVKELLDPYGTQRRDYFLTRGNHDRPHAAEEDPRAAYETGTRLPGDLVREHPDTPVFTRVDGTFYDNFSDFFALPYEQMWSSRVGQLRVVGLDFSDATNSGGGTVYPEQVEAFREELSGDPNRPTIVLSHHPLTREEAITAMGSRPYLIDRATSREIETIESAAPGTFLHLSGHTHRGRRSRGHIATNVDFVGTTASGEHPCAYTVLSLYTGDYTLTSH